MPTKDPELKRAKNTRKFQRRRATEKAKRVSEIEFEKPEFVPRKGTFRKGEVERQRERWIERTLWLAALKNHPCGDCGGFFRAPAMDFHHPDGDGNRFNFRTASKARVLAEIEKCVLLCACCHRLRHSPSEPPPLAKVLVYWLQGTGLLVRQSWRGPSGPLCVLDRTGHDR